MLEALPPLPLTAGERLAERFSLDPRPGKFSLATGTYRDGEGRTPLLECVRRAEDRLLGARAPKDYTAYTGTPAFEAAVQALLLGKPSGARSAQVPGGTAALRLAGELLKRADPAARIWVGDPTWPNHLGVLQAAGLEILRHPYVPGALPGEARRGDAVLLQACCHNPSGMDPTPAQWETLAKNLTEKGILPVLDIAFLGYAEGIEEDLRPARVLAEAAPELLVCTSFSKSMELYGERVGALTIVGSAETAFGHARALARVNWSRPPAHGGAIVTEVLTDPELRALWEREVAGIRARIRRMRDLLSRGLGIDRIQREKGIFTRLPVTPDQVERLEKEEGIYLLPSGWINVVAMTEAQLGRLLGALRR